MKKRIAILIFTAFLFAALLPAGSVLASGDWICSGCGRTVPAILGEDDYCPYCGTHNHTWMPADSTKPETCSCGETRGEPLGNDGRENEKSDESVAADQVERAPAENAPADEVPAEEASVDEVPDEGTKAMTHAEYMAAANDSEVLIESYVQAHQSWWDNKVIVYLQSEDGAYFAYEMQCSEEDAAKLVPGTKIRVKGYKSEWAGEVEITDCTFEFVEADPWIAEAADVTALLATEELKDHMNELVSIKGAVVTAQENGEAFSYKNTEEKSDDLYYAVTVDGQTYNFCVEFYLCGKDTEVYKAVEGLKVGDVVDLEGFLYWYNGANLHTTGMTVR